MILYSTKLEKETLILIKKLKEEGNNFPIPLSEM